MGAVAPDALMPEFCSMWNKWGGAGVGLVEGAGTGDADI
jgi:hypothetical protein